MDKEFVYENAKPTIIRWHKIARSENLKLSKIDFA